MLKKYNIEFIADVTLYLSVINYTTDNDYNHI